MSLNPHKVSHKSPVTALTDLAAPPLKFSPAPSKSTRRYTFDSSSSSGNFDSNLLNAVATDYRETPWPGLPTFRSLSTSSQKSPPSFDSNPPRREIHRTFSRKRYDLKLFGCMQPQRVSPFFPVSLATLLIMN